MSKKQNCVDCQVLGMQKILDYWIQSTFAIRYIKDCIELWNKWLVKHNSKQILYLNEKDNCIFLLKNKYYKELV